MMCRGRNARQSPIGYHRLQASSARGQWSEEADIDWHQDIRRPPWLLRRFHAALISQFMYGETATVRICQKLFAQTADPVVRNLLAQQIADERRHARVYERYLARLGDHAPEDPALAETVARVLAWNGSALGLVAAVHILLEGEALRTLGELVVDYPCPLFAQLNQKICRDEARHVAFGTLYLQHNLPALRLDERREIFRFVKSVWHESTSRVLSAYRIPGVVTQPLRHKWVQDGWHRHSRALARVGLLSASEQDRIG